MRGRDTERVIALSGTPHAVLYTRVSSDDQADGTSLDAQITECRRYAARLGFVIDSEFTDVMSGTKDHRPAYQALLSRVRELHADAQPGVVVVAALDRFGRRVMERVRSREELRTLGVPTHSVREGGEVSDLTANILASVAQEEVTRLRMRVSTAWENLSDKGWAKIAGRTVAWGYRSRLATAPERAAGSPRTVIEVDAESAPYVAEAFARVAKGDKLGAVARWASGLPESVRAYRDMPGATGRLIQREGARPISKRYLNEILRLPVYIGRNDPDAVGETRWQPIVSREIWDAVQARLDAQASVPRQASLTYLCTGFLFCAACNNRMHGQTLRTRDYRRYRCQGGQYGGTCNVTVRAAAVDTQVLAEITALLDNTANPDCKRKLAKSWDQLTKPAIADDNTLRMRQLEQTIATMNARVGRATDDYADRAISKDAYDGLVARAEAAAEAAQSELATLRAKQQTPAVWPSLERVLQAAGEWSAAMASADVQSQRDVLSKLVRGIRASRTGRTECHTEIEWSPLGQKLVSAVEAVAA